MDKHFVLICSGQISLNPRLVKEADALYNAGHQVTVIYLYWNKWAKSLDETLLQRKKWKSIRVGGDPDESALLYGITRVIFRISKLLAKYVGFKNNIAELAIGRGTWFLTKAACKHSADMYIAHNLAALPVAVKAAKKNHSRCGFDAEDFYRNDTIDDPESLDVKLKKFLEEKYYPQAGYVTASSEEIANKYEQLFPSKKIQIILNVFPEYLGQIEYNNNHKELKLFWFSQSVGLCRGIQDVIAAMKILEEENIEFHILGDLNKQIEAALNQFKINLDFKIPPRIIYHKPIDPDELVRFACQFDIGLATEPGFSINNNIALSNKLFTYINAGLAIIASDTIAQERFIKNYPAIGKTYCRENALSLSKILKGYIDDRASLSTARKASYLLGKNKLNWKRESEKFINLINATLERPLTD